MEVVVLHPLTEAEKERRPGRFLAALLAGELGGRNRAASTDPRPLVERLLEGGFPEPLFRSPGRVRQWHRDYLNQILQRDVREVSRVRRTADLARLLELLAGRTATLLNVNGLANALAISRETVSHYLEVLERMFLIRRLLSWNRTASKRFVRAPKVHLTDTGLAATLAERTSADWLRDRAAMGRSSRIVRRSTTRRPGGLDGSRSAVLALPGSRWERGGSRHYSRAGDMGRGGQGRDGSGTARHARPDPARGSMWRKLPWRNRDLYRRGSLAARGSAHPLGRSARTLGAVRRSRHPVLGGGAALTLVWRSVISAGFALPRDAGRRPVREALSTLEVASSANRHRDLVPGRPADDVRYLLDAPGSRHRLGHPPDHSSEVERPCFPVVRVRTHPGELIQSDHPNPIIPVRSFQSDHPNPVIPVRSSGPRLPAGGAALPTIRRRRDGRRWLRGPRRCRRRSGSGPPRRLQRSGGSLRCLRADSTPGGADPPGFRAR